MNNQLSISGELQLTNRIKELSRLVVINETTNDQIEKDYEHFSIQFHEATKDNIILKYGDIESDKVLLSRNEEISIIFNQTLHKTLQIETDYKTVLQIIREILQEMLNNYINKWKLNQLSDSTEILNLLQKWFEEMADIIWETRNQIRKTSLVKIKLLQNQPQQRDFLPEYLQEITELLTLLVTNSFVIEKQPLQVLKTKIK